MDGTKREGSIVPKLRLAVPIALLTTACVLLLSLPAGAVTAPYFEDFEAEPLCTPTCGAACPLTATGWTNATGDDIDWTVHAGPTQSTGTGPSTDHNPGTATGKYLYVEATQPCYGGQVANLVSPPLELQGTTNPRALFWYHMDGGWMGDLHVDLFDGNGWQLDIIAPITDDLDQWQQTPLLDLSPWIGSTVNLRLRGITGSYYESDMAVDDFAFVDLNSNDVGVVAILDPVDGMCGMSTDEVVVEVMNYGLNVQSNVPVQVQVAGAVTATLSGTLTGPIVPLGGTDMVALGPLNTFSGGAITLDATTQLSGDQDPGNDALATVAANLAPMEVVVTAPGPVCPGETASLAVTAPETGVTYGWYDLPSGGTQLGTGATFTTPALTQNTSYYTQREYSPADQVGPLDNTIGTGGNHDPAFGRGLVFDVTSAVLIDSVQVYPDGPGDVVVRLLDGNANVLAIATVTVNTAGNKTPIPLGFYVAPGTGYVLDGVGTTTGGLYRNNAGTSYPYAGTNLQITGPTNNNPIYYYYFYDWAVLEPVCTGETTQVLVSVDPAQCTVDLATAMADDPDPVAAGGTLIYTVTVTNNGAQDAPDVVLTTTLPGEVANPQTLGCAEDPAGVSTCSLGTVAAGASAVVTIDVDVSSGATGTFTAQAAVATTGTDTDPNNDGATEDTTIGTGGAGGSTSSGTGGSSSGTGGSTSSGTGGSTSSGEGGDGVGPIYVEDSGCGCRVVGDEGHQRRAPWAPLALASLWLGLGLCRRRSA